jgi:hypothetical protein
MAEAEDQGELSLEEQFAQILYALMRDDVSAAAAIHAFEKASVAVMQQYRCAQAEQQLQCNLISEQQQPVCTDLTLNSCNNSVCVDLHSSKRAAVLVNLEQESKTPRTVHLPAASSSTTRRQARVIKHARLQCVECNT